MKKSLKVIASAAMVFSMFASVSLADNAATMTKTSKDFKDMANVDASLVAKIDIMLAKGYMDGKSSDTFDVMGNMTRAEAAKLVCKIFNIHVDDSIKASSFSDVSADDNSINWAIPYIEAARKAGLIDGITDTAFAPKDNVTIGQLATLYVKGLGKKSDVKVTVPWYQGYLDAAKTNGIGFDTKDGDATASRADLVIGSYAADQVYSNMNKHAEFSGVTQQTGTLYQLTDTLQVEIKSLLNETVSDGTRIGAVIRVKSSMSTVQKLPDLDLRVKTADGTEYVLQASVFNAHAIRPQTTEELNYYVTVDSKVPVDLTDLVWYSVDWYSYPKQETVQLSAPVTGLSWNGTMSELADASVKKSWGDTFVFPDTMDSPLKYTPVSVSKDNTADGPVSTVELLVENPSSKRESIPDFTLDGKTDSSDTDKTVYNGKRTEQGIITLEPNEKKYIHFTIPTEKNAVLTSFYVLNQETFRQLDAKGQASAIAYNIGRFHIDFPSAAENLAAFNRVPDYKSGEAFVFDNVSDAVDPHLAVALVDLDRHENEGDSSQTVIAKFKMTNTGDVPIPVPTFQTKLLTEKGLQYSGSRQSASTADIMPQTSYVISYAFTLPAESNDPKMILKFSDSKAGGLTGTTIGAYKVMVLDPTMDNKEMAFYPFHVKLNTWTVSAETNLPSVLFPAPISYTYRMMMDLDIEREEKVIVDQNFSKMRIELVDPTGKEIGYKDLPFTGTDRIVSGKQFIHFDKIRTDEQDYPLTVKIYELITASSGEAKRLMAELK